MSRLARKSRWPSADDKRRETIARIYGVPYWMIDGSPRPSWLRRPLWRLRALLWR